MKFIYVPFILQACTIMIDEFIFHERRGLPLWEKIGHPLDTLSILLCYFYLLWGQADPFTYALLAGFSCLLITKDEFVHSKLCPAMENWLHAVLFILHPISLFAAYQLVSSGEKSFLKIQTFITIIFMCYQAIRWSLPWRLKTK
jgi:hypothetical protein